MVVSDNIRKTAEDIFSNIDSVVNAGLNKNGERCSRCFSIANTVFELDFDSERLKEYFTWQMRLFVTEEKPSAYIHIWTDELAGKLAYQLEEGKTSASFSVNLGEREIKIYMIGRDKRVSGFIFAWCAEMREGWVIIQPDQLEAFIEVSFMLTPLFSRFATDIGMTLIHAAGVGVGNCGVLLSGLSGAGKSSLATACLMNGMSYVSDDSMFLNASDSTLYPTCSTIHVAPDIMKIYPKLQGPEFLSRRGRAEKRHLDISSLQDQFAVGMEAKAIIYLVISDSEDYGIRPMRWEAAVVPLVFSSAHLLGEAQNAVALKDIMKSLRKLPAYEFRLTGNLTFNAKYLEQFIRENIMK